MNRAIYTLICIAIASPCMAIGLELEVSQNRKGNNITFEISADSSIEGCRYSILGASRRKILNNSSSKTFYVAEWNARETSETYTASRVKKLSSDLRNRKLFFALQATCGTHSYRSEVVSLRVKKQENGKPSKKAWLKGLRKKLVRTIDPDDDITTRCSINDTFTFTELGSVLNASNVGVSVGTTIADSSSFITSDGKVRKYFFTGGVGLKTATASDGINFSIASGNVIAEGSAAHNKVFLLPDGRYRLFTTVSALGGIVSYVTSDETSFTLEDGVRISIADSGLASLSHLSIVATRNQGYRGYFSDLAQPGGSIENRSIKSATSTDMLNWTVENKILLGPEASRITEPAEQPHALLRGKHCVTLFYFKALAEDGRPMGLYYSTSKTGKKFTNEFYSGINGNGPDIVRLPNGEYILYYDSGTNESGFQISAARLELDD